MTEITLRGKPIHTAGELPAVGSKAPDFGLVSTKLADITLSDLAGKKVVLNIFPSVDTPTCAKSVRTFNEEAAKRDNAAVLCVSADLPFAQQRFCGSEGLDKVTPASAFRSQDFGKDYGVEMVDGPLKGLLSRAVVVIDENGTVTHAEQVSEIGDEPNYEAALAKL